MFSGSTLRKDLLTLLYDRGLQSGNLPLPTSQMPQVTQILYILFCHCCKSGFFNIINKKKKVLKYALSASIISFRGWSLTRREQLKSLNLFPLDKRKQRDGERRGFIGHSELCGQVAIAS